MDATELIALTCRLFDRSGIPYSSSDADASVVVALDEDRAAFIGTCEAVNLDGREWRVLCLSVPLLENVEASSIPPTLIGEVNHELLIGKLAYIEDDHALALEHELVGWPGAGEYAMVLELLASNASVLAGRLATEVGGSEPAKFTKVVG
jgi:hypothetical protein